jgi:hypothetical protein
MLFKKRGKVKHYHKLEKIRASPEELKNKGKIRIKNGEIIR